MKPANTNIALYLLQKKSVNNRHPPNYPRMPIECLLNTY